MNARFFRATAVEVNIQNTSKPDLRVGVLNYKAIVVMY